MLVNIGPTRVLGCGLMVFAVGESPTCTRNREHPNKVISVQEIKRSTIRVYNILLNYHKAANYAG